MWLKSILISFAYHYIKMRFILFHFTEILLKFNLNMTQIYFNFIYTSLH